MKKKNDLGAATILVAAALIAAALYFGPATSKGVVTVEKIKQVTTFPPCDIYPDWVEGKIGDDWCQPYIDYGYYNGLAMGQRVWGEQQFFCGAKEAGNPLGSGCDEKLTAEQVLQDLYDVAEGKTDARFPTRNREL